MTVTASGSMALAIDAARTLVLASTAFTARVAAAPTQGTAAEHVYLDIAENYDRLQDLRPFLSLKYADRNSVVIAEGVAVDLIVNGDLVLVIEDNANYPEPTDHNDSYLDFLNFAGGVIDDIEELSGSDAYLPFRSEMLIAPRRTPRAEREEKNDYWATAFRLTYGDQL